MVIASSDIYIRDQHVVNTLGARAIALQNELKRGAHGCITRQQITLIALPASSKRTSTSDSFHGSATLFLWLFRWSNITRTKAMFVKSLCRWCYFAISQRAILALHAKRRKNKNSIESLYLLDVQKHM